MLMCVCVGGANQGGVSEVYYGLLRVTILVVSGKIVRLRQLSLKYIYCSPPCACHALTVFSSRHKSRLELAILAFKLYKNNYTVDGPLGSLRLTVTARKRGH